MSPWKEMEFWEGSSSKSGWADVKLQQGFSFWHFLSIQIHVLHILSIISRKSMISNISLQKQILISNRLSDFKSCVHCEAVNCFMLLQPRSQGCSSLKYRLSTMEIQSKSHEMRVKSAPWNCQRYESENIYCIAIHQISSPCCVLRHRHSCTNHKQLDPSIHVRHAIRITWLHRINTDMRTNARHVTSTNLQQCPKKILQYTNITNIPTSFICQGKGQCHHLQLLNRGHPGMPWGCHGDRNWLPRHELIINLTRYLGILLIV